MNEDTASSNAVELATELTIAWLSNPNTRASSNEVPDFLRTMHAAVQGLEAAPATDEPEQASAEHVPAVTSRRSLASKDHIISMIDGKPYKTLRRHLSTHGLTPDDYRQRYGLKADYPMVAPTYAEMRRDMAKRIGLGRKPRQPAADTGDAGDNGEGAAAPAKRRGRPPRKQD